MHARRILFCQNLSNYHVNFQFFSPKSNVSISMTCLIRLTFYFLFYIIRYINQTKPVKRFTDVPQLVLSSACGFYMFSFLPQNFQLSRSCSISFVYHYSKKCINSYLLVLTSSYQFPLSKVCGNYYTILDNIRKEIFIVIGYFEKQSLL